MEKENLKQLVLAAQAGDSAASQQLFEETYQDIYYYILKTVKEKELAEDLTQDVYLRLWEKLGDLKAPEAFISWSRQIAHHHCTDYFRKRKELLLDEYEDGGTEFDSLPEEDVEFIPHEALDRKDLQNTILEMLNSLPQEQRSAMVLRYYDELPVSQIAQVQRVSEGTVKSRLNYGRKAMAKCVEDYEKRNGVKLHSIAILPLLLWLFRRQKAESGAPLVSTSAAASACATTAGGGGAMGGIKTFFTTGLGKTVACVAIAAVALFAVLLATKEDAPTKDAPEPPIQMENPWQDGGYYEGDFSDPNWVEVSSDVCRRYAVIYERAAHNDPRLFSDVYEGQYLQKDADKIAARLEGDNLVSVLDAVYLRPAFDFEGMVNDYAFEMAPAPYSFSQIDGITYCTFTPENSESFACQAETIEQAAVQVLETYGPILEVYDLDINVPVEPYQKFEYGNTFREPSHEQRLQELLGIGFASMTFRHAAGKGTKEALPPLPAPQNNVVDLRQYVNVNANNYLYCAPGYADLAFIINIRLQYVRQDYSAYHMSTIPEDHPYYKYWDDISSPQVDSTIEYVAQQLDAIRLKLHVPQGRDWTAGGNPIKYGLDVSGTFREGDVLHFSWEVNREVIANLETLLGVKFVWEDFTYTVPALPSHQEDDPTDNITLVLEGADGNGYVSGFTLDYPGMEGLIFSGDVRNNGSLCNGETAQIRLDDDFWWEVLDYGIDIGAGRVLVNVPVSGLPEA